MQDIFVYFYQDNSDFVGSWPTGVFLYMINPQYGGIRKGYVWGTVLVNNFCIR